MDRAGEMSILVACVDAGGFTAAAQRLGLTPSAISKAVTRLEQRLGVRLLERTTRRIALTPDGASYLAQARRILADLEDMEAAVMASRDVARGRVRVEAGVAFAVYQLAPALPDFQRRYPEVTLDLSISDHITDPIATGTDVTIRTGAVGDERLVGRRFAQTHRVIAAAPAYLAAHGAPQAPQDLARHVCINIAAARHLSLWPFRTRDGAVTIDTESGLMVDNAITALALGVAGYGIVRLGDVIAGPALARGELVPVLADQHVSEAVPLQLVYAPGRQRLPRVRAVLDFVAERFKDSPWRATP